MSIIRTSRSNATDRSLSDSRRTASRGPSRRRLSAFASLGVALLGASLLVTPPPAGASQSAVGLGRAKPFAVLAGSGITNTGPTTITGDVGSFPTPTQTGFGSVTLNGANEGGNSNTQGAKDDLVTAYNDAAGRAPANNVAVELGGSTLLGGVYASPTFGLTGTLTLDAEGNPDAQFIFQAASTLIAETNSRVLLVNGADPCHVVWKVGSSATFKTGTRFAGDVIALASITAQTSATFQGRLLARDGAVTLETNTITRSDCATTTTTTGSTATTVAGTGTTTTSPGGTGGTGGGTGGTSATGNTGATGQTGGTPATTVTSSPNPSQPGQVVELTATVTGPGSTTPGSVTFFDGSNPLGTAPLVAGQATLATSRLTVGEHSITARSGDAATATNSTSAAIRQVVTDGTAAPVTTSGLPRTGSPAMIELAFGLLLVAAGGIALHATGSLSRPVVPATAPARQPRR